MAIYSFAGITPVIHKTAFIHPQASIIGDVWIEKNCYVGPFASLRGDFNRIILKQGSNVQDSCTVHGYPDQDCILEENAHIGHGAVIHSAIIGFNSLIGMQAVIMDLAEVGENSIVAAKCLVPTGYKVPANTLVAGLPCKIIKSLSASTIKMKQTATKSYIELSKQCHQGLLEVPRSATDDSNLDLASRKSQKPYWPKMSILTTKSES